ncbi:MAG: protein kinase [Candidatus Eisenbacteria bacterium]|nr:protein kinase [Candidatus Eisenbacteria bacterium]
MPLLPGTRLGPYEILGPLGAGGMGEVYKARDSRLDRTVAVKVLPEHLSLQPEVRARFEREARAVSSLNHPNICTLHDVGHQDGVDYLVMELVEGETLAARLDRGPLAPAEILRTASEIADALDKAHRGGIVHRDLKPGNIMLTKGGAKLLDFGLARGAGLDAPAGSLTQSPTMSRPLTAEGSIVGTFQYMAPEQLEGAEADARTDIFALGVTLYEMATGRRAFEGRTQASLIASILKEEPRSISELQPLSPPGLERLVKACMAKDPEERVQTAHDVKLQLRWIAEGGSQAGVPAPVSARRRGRERVACAVAAVAAAAAVGLGIFLFAWPRPAPVPVRFVVTRSGGMRSLSWPRVSPDGLTLAFLATDSTGRGSIWVRPLNSLTAYPLPGTEGAGRPYWSPDSRFLAYFDGPQIKKIAVAGGPPMLVCNTTRPAPCDISWSKGGVLLFDGRASDSLEFVPAGGGTPQPASFPDRRHGASGDAWPYFLPDGKHFLYLTYGMGTTKGPMLMGGELGSKKVKQIGGVGSRVEYAPQGYLVYASDATLVARPFDPGRMAFTGEPFPVAEHVNVLGDDNADFSVSPSGVLAYLPNASTERSELAWFDRGGRELEKAAPPDAYRDISLSPDETRVAYGLQDGRQNTEDIWVRDLKRGVSTRLTFDTGNELQPLWSADGNRVAYTAFSGGPLQLRAKLASGAGQEEALTAPYPDATGSTSWSRDGSTLVFQRRAATGWDVGIQSLTGDRKQFLQLHSPFNEMRGRLSPDEKWLAYQSNESGRMEVYVQPFPGPGGKWQVSSAGGGDPKWRADGKELFFRSPAQELMAVPVRTGAGFESGSPVRLFQKELESAGFQLTRYAPSANGQRFLLNVPLSSSSQAAFNIVLNWAAETKRK